ELYYEAERYAAPPHLTPSWRNQPQRYTARGCAVKRLDHVNFLAADVRASREFCQELLGYRLYERIAQDDGTGTGGWMTGSRPWPVLGRADGRELPYLRHSPGPVSERFEVMPFGRAEEEAAQLPEHARLTVTCSPRHGLEESIEVATRIRALGPDVTLHLAA